MLDLYRERDGERHQITKDSLLERLLAISNQNESDRVGACREIAKLLGFYEPDERAERPIKIVIGSNAECGD